MSRTTISDVPVQFRPVLQRIESIFSAPVWIYDYDEEWLNFWYYHLTDAGVIVELERQKHNVLPGMDRQLYQILTQSDQDGDGLYIHHLSTSRLRSEYRSGMWFY